LTLSVWHCILSTKSGRRCGENRMVEIAELTAQHTLELPAEVAARFRPADRFVVWVEGDIVHLKRITPPPVTSVVAEAPEEEPLSLDEINEIVHQVRRQRRTG
jgi:hypothetical protein